MSTQVLWPHRLVFNFPYGRWCTLVFLFSIMFLLFYTAGSINNVHAENIPLFFCLIIAYLIPASHYINQQIVTAFDGLTPSLDLDSTEIQAIRDSLTGASFKTQMNTLVAGFIAGCLHSYFLLTARGGLIETLQILDLFNIVTLLTTILVWCLFSTVILFLILNVRIFAKLARENVRIDLLDTANLRPFSRVAVFSTLVLLGALASFPLLLVENEPNYLTVLPGFIATLLPMVFIFLIPLLPIRKRIRECKERELTSIRNEINRLISTKNNLVVQNSTESLAGNEALLSALQPLLSYRTEVKQVSEWPFDSPVVLRLVFYLIIPPATWVGSALIERLVDTVNL